MENKSNDSERAELERKEIVRQSLKATLVATELPDGKTYCEISFEPQDEPPNQYGGG